MLRWRRTESTTSALGEVGASHTGSLCMHDHLTTTRGKRRKRAVGWARESDEKAAESAIKTHIHSIQRYCDQRDYDLVDIVTEAGISGKLLDRRAITKLFDMAAAGLTLSWLWWYAQRNPHLVAPDIDPRLVRYNNLRALIVPLVFFLSIGVSFLNVNVAKLCWVHLFMLRPELHSYIERDRQTRA